MAGEIGGTGDMATFQQGRSEFAEIVKYLINEVAKSATRLEDHMLMHPASGFERRAERDPYRDFRAAFRELYFLTFNTVRNETLKQAIDYWFKEHYDSTSKNDTFLQGIKFGKDYLTEMYNLGLLDLNVSEPVDFPFEDIIRDISAEKARFAQMYADISITPANFAQARAIAAAPNVPTTDLTVVEEPKDILALVNTDDPDLVQSDDEHFDQFDGTATFDDTAIGTHFAEIEEEGEEDNNW